MKLDEAALNQAHDLGIVDAVDALMETAQTVLLTKMRTSVMKGVGRLIIDEVHDVRSQLRRETAMVMARGAMNDDRDDG